MAGGVEARSMRKRGVCREAAVLLCAVSLSLPEVARADEAPAADATNLVPPEAGHKAPSESEPSAPSGEPVELLPTKHPERVAAYVFAGAAVAGLAVGAVFGALTLAETNSWNSSNHASSGALGYLNQANQDSVVCDVGFGVAAIAGITSVVLFLRPQEPSTAPPAHPAARFIVAPVLTAHTAGAGVLVRF
jgi:hypothetical protein